jgi:hypothetical protein
MSKVWSMRWVRQIRACLPLGRAQRHRCAGWQLGRLEGLVLVELDPGAGRKDNAIDFMRLVQRGLVPCFVDLLRISLITAEPPKPSPTSQN